jgi:flagellar hook-associated protein 3 FlgL
MRVSTNYQFETMRSKMNTAGDNYRVAQQRVSSGKRINTLSDDPRGLSDVLTMRGVKASIEQYKTNLNRAETWLKTSESSLSEIGNLLNRANSLAVSGATATTSLDARRAMAAEVQTIRDQVLSLANSKGPTGGYLFSGTATDTQPFNVTTTGVSYQGNSGTMKVEASASDSVTINADAQQLFTTLYTTLDQLKTNLEGGSTSTISDVSIKAVQDGISQLNNLRGDVGTRAKSVESFQNDHSRRIEELTSSISDIEDVDLSQAIMEYKSAETAYQASLQVMSQGFGLSLLNYLK